MVKLYLNDKEGYKTKEYLNLNIWSLLKCQLLVGLIVIGLLALWKIVSTYAVYIFTNLG